jgi:hypothetical protein
MSYTRRAVLKSAAARQPVLGGGGEKTPFQLAYQLEAAQPWARRYPPGFAA